MGYRVWAAAWAVVVPAGPAAGVDPLGYSDSDPTPLFKLDGLKPGQLPPPGSAREEAARVVWVDPLHRRAKLFFERVKIYEDMFQPPRRPVEVDMLPYAAVRYHAAWADLRDLPPGLRVHAKLYADGNGRLTRGLLLEDDFSRMTAAGSLWEVAEAATAAGKLVLVERPADPKPDGPKPKPVTFQVGGRTRYWKGDRVTSYDQVKAGDKVLVNLTGDLNSGTPGPGYCTDVWLDAESRELATAVQRWRHEEWLRTRGLPAVVTAVDDRANKVTVALAPDAGPFAAKGGELPGKLTAGRRVNVAAAQASRQAFRPFFDQVSATTTAVEAGEPGVGTCGWAFTFEPKFMLEGFRPGRAVLVFLDDWPIRLTPIEEVYHPEANP